jgi:thiamine biosynthesis lipoprotein
MDDITSVFGIAFSAMACHCEVRLTAFDAVTARSVAQCAMDEVRRIETKYSRYRPDSIVSRINVAAGGAWVDCDDETIALFGYADALFEVSGGLFDITSGVLRRAWDFRHARIPSVEELQPLLAMIGWEKVQRRQYGIRLPKSGMEIDFGGFGKEYAVDRAAAVLMEQGVQSGYINLGGDMRIIGPQPDGSPWMIGIQDPRKVDEVIAMLPVHSGALATSGDYERFFETNGKRYCHILDPRSGQPVRGWRSVSVLAPLAVAAGSYTTIAMLKGAEALSFLKDSNLPYLAMDGQGKIHSRDSKNHMKTSNMETNAIGKTTQSE